MTRWPPNNAWTSAFKKKGYRHFVVKQYGGQKDRRWVELSAVNNKNIRITLLWSELKNPSEWKSGWQQLPKEEDCQRET